MEAIEMSIRELIEYVASKYTLEDVCYMLGKEPEWLLWKIKYDILQNRREFISGDEYYTETNDYD